MTAPNPQRRSERSRQAILTAALQLCQEQGFALTTVEAIAKRAGVGKQTIYRWWPSKGAVVLDALLETVQTSAEFPDTGDVVADLRTQMTAVAQALSGAELPPMLQGLIAAAQTDPDLAATVLQVLIEPRSAACRKRLERAREQGQLRAEVEPADIVELLYAPFYYRLLLNTRPITTDQVDTVLDLAFAGVAKR